MRITFVTPLVIALSLVLFSHTSMAEYIHLKDGRTISVKSYWHDDNTINYQRYGTVVGIPIENIDKIVKEDGSEVSFKNNNESFREIQSVERNKNENGDTSIAIKAKEFIGEMISEIEKEKIGAKYSYSQEDYIHSFDITDSILRMIVYDNNNPLNVYLKSNGANASVFDYQTNANHELKQEVLSLQTELHGILCLHALSNIELGKEDFAKLDYLTLKNLNLSSQEDIDSFKKLQLKLNIVEDTPALTLYSKRDSKKKASKSGKSLDYNKDVDEARERDLREAGCKLFSNKDFMEARKKFALATQENPRDPRNWSNLAFTYGVQGVYGYSDYIFNKAVELCEDRAILGKIQNNINIIEVFKSRDHIDGRQDLLNMRVGNRIKVKYNWGPRRISMDSLFCNH